MGNFFTSKKTSTENVDMGPWSGQQPYLKDAWSKGQSLYNNQNSQPGYEGDFVAGMSPQQTGILQQYIDYYGGTGTQRADSLYDKSVGMTDTGMSGVTNSANAMTDFANRDRTGAIISDASRVADNPYMSGMVDAAMSDAYRKASENTIPNLYRDAAAGSNLNSSRTALMQGVVERGLAEKTADVSATLRGDAYNTGLKIGAGNQAMTLDALGGAGGLYDSLNRQGLLANDLATGQRGEAADRVMSNAEMLRQGKQLELDNNYEKFRYKEDRPWDLLNRYYNLVGSNNWGKTGTATTISKDQMSPAAGVAAIIGSIASLMKGGASMGMKF